MVSHTLCYLLGYQGCGNVYRLVGNDGKSGEASEGCIKSYNRWRDGS